MAGEAYYYLFSNAMVIIILFYLYMVGYYRLKNKTILGQKFEQASPEYIRLKRLGGNYGLTVTILLGLAFCANLAFAASKILRLNTPDADFILVFAPLFSVVLYVIAIVTILKKFGNTVTRS